jgi:hypothetical protein
LARQRDVVDVTPLPADETLILDPPYRLSDSEFGHVLLPPVEVNPLSTPIFGGTSAKTQFAPFTCIDQANAWCHARAPSIWAGPAD